MSYSENQAGAAQFEFRQAGSIRKGEYCFLNDSPCKVTDLSVSKPGKHGSAKVLITGVNIFTDKKNQEIYSTSATVKVPVVKKFELEVVDIANDDYVSFLLPDSTLKEDLKLPGDRQKELRSAFEANKDDCQLFYNIIAVGNDERIIGHRVHKN